MVDSFRAQAHRREQPVTSITYASDPAPRPGRIRNVGYLDKVLLFSKINGQYATAGPTGTDQMGRYSGPLQRITLRVGSQGVLYDVSGFSAFLIAAIDTYYNHGSASLAPLPYAFTTTPGTAAFANVFPNYIPLGLNLKTFDAPVGLVQTAVQGQDVVVELVHAPIAAAATALPGSALYLGNEANLGAASTVSSITDLKYEYFDPIPADRFPKAQPNLGIVHTWNEFQVPIVGDGDLDIELNPANMYTRFVITVVSGTTGALAITNNILSRLRLSYGGAQSPYDFDNNTIKSRMARQFGALAWPAGVYILDLIADTHDEQNVFNAAATTNPRLQVTLTGGTYGTGSHIRVAYEQLVPLNDGRNTYGPQGAQ